MDKILFSLILVFAFTSTACDRAKHSAKEAINKTGETIGQSTTEFVGSVSEGVNRSTSSRIELSEPLVAKGLQTGKFKMRAEPTGAEPHILSVYLIFDKTLSDTLQVRVLDSKGTEYGRTRQAVAGKQGQAGYVDFVFDPRTEFESRSLFVIE